VGERVGTALQERQNQDENKKEEKVTHKKSLSPVPVCRHLKPESGETSWDSTGQSDSSLRIWWVRRSSSAGWYMSWYCASGGCAVAILTELRVEMRQAQVAVGEKVD